MTPKELEAVAHQTAIEISSTRVMDIHVKRKVLEALKVVNHRAYAAGERRGRSLRARAARATNNRSPKKA